MSVEGELADKLRHGMSVLWTEIVTSRETTADILKKMESMMSVHDDTKSLIAEIRTLFESIKGEQGNSDAAIQDLKDEATALRDEMKAFVASASGASGASASTTSIGSFTSNTGSAS